MHPTYLSGIERGIRNPTWSKITSLAQTLGVPVSAIVRTAEQEAEVCAGRTGGESAHPRQASLSTLDGWVE
jgi:transcriptional regulator with XRE-family HTH domain